MGLPRGVRNLGVRDSLGVLGVLGVLLEANASALGLGWIVVGVNWGGGQEIGGGGGGLVDGGRSTVVGGAGLISLASAIL